METTDYERLGGEDGLRRLVDAYVDRFAGDMIIGFLFQGKDLARVKEHEAALASQHLGGPGRYQGRGLAASHRPMKINRGQFRRRLALVRQVLREGSVDEGLIERWLAFEQRLMPMVTDGTDCAPAEK